MYYCFENFRKKYAENYVTIWESFQINMLPGGETVVAFCGRILALRVGGICECLGANAWGFPGVAADKCIIH